MTELRDEFHAMAQGALEQRGWRSARATPFHIAPTEGRFFLPSDDDIVLEACLRFHESFSEPAMKRAVRGVAVVGADVGVTCPAAERLLAAVAARWINVAVSEDVGIVAGEGEISIPVSNRAELETAVGNVIGLVDLAVRRSTATKPDGRAFIEAICETPDMDEFYGEAIPAVLFVTGHEDEALKRLGEYGAAYRDPDYDSFCKRFQTFVVTHATAPAPSETAFHTLTSQPAPPAPSREPRPPRPPRGQNEQAPIRGIRAWMKAAVWFRDLARVVARGGIGGLRASEAQWHEIDVSDDAQATLASCHDSAATRIGDTAFVNVSLMRTATGTSGTMDVVLGGRVVGHLNSQVGTQTTSALARLTRRKAPRAYVLEVQLSTREHAVQRDQDQRRLSASDAGPQAGTPFPAGDGRETP